MKNIILFLAIILVNTAFSQYQTKTVIDTIDIDKDASLYYYLSNPSTANNNYGNSAEFRAEAWTWGQNYFYRGVMEADLSNIPANAIITSARLYLYSNFVSGVTYTYQANYNESKLYPITDNWSESTITWNTNIAHTTEGAIDLARSTANNQNYVADIKDLVQKWVNGSLDNNGLLFKLNTEYRYRRMTFASSDHTNTALRPKLVISYNIPVKNVAVNITKDAAVRDSYSSTNYGNYQYIEASKDS
jgi:hypothetical protein